MPSLRRARSIILEHHIAVWLWREQRAVSMSEIAGEFFISLREARRCVHRLMSNTEGVRCRLETAPGINSAGNRGIVKYFSVQSVPGAYLLTKGEAEEKYIAAVDEKEESAGSYPAPITVIHHE